VVDTTGGGDSFMAGFLCEYIRSGDPLRAARWGSATAACVIEQSGGVHIGRMPTREVVLDRLATAYGAL
jgi:sugar/nucleoside kinase (ribokinase family)